MAVMLAPAYFAEDWRNLRLFFGLEDQAFEI